MTKAKEEMIKNFISNHDEGIHFIENEEIYLNDKLFKINGVIDKLYIRDFSNEEPFYYLCENTSLTFQEFNEDSELIGEVYSYNTSYDQRND